MTNEKFYEGIEIGKRYEEYSKAELEILPPLPNVEKGIDYPEFFKNQPPFVWTGRRWVLDYE